MIKINIKNKSNITVCDDSGVVYTMIRKTPLFSSTTVGEIFQERKKIGKISIGKFLKKKILYQNFPNTIEIVNQHLFVTDFLIDKNLIKIQNNPFFFFNKKTFSRIYYNSELVANVSMKKIFDIEGYNLEVNFVVKNKQIEYYSTICYLIYCIEFNV